MGQANGYGQPYGGQQYYGGQQPYGGYGLQRQPQGGDAKMGGGGGYGGQQQMTPADVQGMIQQFQQQNMNPNQQNAAQNGMGSRAFYSPFNSPYGGMRGPGPDYAQIQGGPPGAMQNSGFGGPANGPQNQGYARPGMNAQLAQPAPQYPSVGLSAAVQALQQGNPAAQGMLNAAAGLGSIGQSSSQNQQPMPQPFSPVRNEGYTQAPTPAPTTNRFTAQNRTRGMSNGAW